MEITTRWPQSAAAAAPDSRAVPSTSTSRVWRGSLARWTTALTPCRASASPAPVRRSPVRRSARPTALAPPVAPFAAVGPAVPAATVDLRDSTATSWPAACSAGTTTRPRVPVPPVTRIRAIAVPFSEHRQVALQLVLGDLGTVVAPLLPLVPQEEVEDVLAEGRGDQLAVLHHGDGLVEAARELPDAERPALAVGQAPDVVLGLVGEVVALFDALEPCGQHDGK